MADRRRGLVFAGLALGAGLGLVASAQPWWRATAGGVAVALPGTEATGGLSQALAVVIAIGALLALALAPRGRQVLGVVLALGGAGMAGVGALRMRPAAAVLETKLRSVTLLDGYSLTATWWPGVYAAAGLLALGSAVGLVVYAPRWLRTGRRFDRRPSAVDNREGRHGADVDRDPAAVWRALDAGLDPTAAPDQPPGAQVRDSSATMERSDRPASSE